MEAQNAELLHQLAELKTSHEVAIVRLNEKLAVEQGLKESQERFETIFHKSQVAQKIINRELKIVEINHALSDLLGYAPEEILGSAIMDYTHPNDKLHWEELQTAIWGQDIPCFDLEVCLIKKDKSYIWCVIHTVLFRNSGETFGYTILENITTRKKLEHHKDDFISIISHELKTPMTALKSQCQLLQRSFKNEPDSYAGKMVAGMEKQTNRLTRLVQNLVLVSKIESGKLRPIMEPYELNDLVNEVVEEFKITTSRDIQLESQPSLIVCGDRDKMHQVVYNLLTNAIKFSERHSLVNVTVHRKGEWAEMCIQDYGQGIPQESLERVFERFYKVETAVSPVESGIGLGLYISSEIVKHQQGKLTVHSVQHEGSTFCFKLPLLKH